MTKFEAVKIEDGREVEHIDPVCSIDFYGEHFTIYNGEWGFDYPVRDFDKWRFRPVAKNN